MGEEKKKAKRSGAMRFLRGVLFSFCGFTLLALLLWGGLQTRWAKDYLADFIESATADTGDYRVRIQKITGLLPFSLMVEKVTLSGPDGEWLAAEGIDFSWKVLSLLTGVIDVQWFRMERLAVTRLPASEEKEPEQESPEENAFPSLPRILLQQMEIKRIELAKEVAGTPMAYRLQMKAETEDRNVKANAVLQNLNDTDDALRLAASYGLENEIISAEISYFEKEGGLAAGLMGLTDAGAIQLAVKADGPLSDVKGKLNLEVGRYGKIDLDFQAGLKEKITADIKGRIQPDERILPKDVTMALGGADFAVHLGATYLPSRILEVKAFTFGTDAFGISLSGSVDLHGETMAITGACSAVNPAPFLEGTGITVKDPGTVQFAAKGDFTNPNVTVNTKVGMLELEGIELHELALEMAGGFEKDFAGLTKADLVLTALRMRVPQAPELKGPLRLTLSGTTPNFTLWNIDAFQVSLPPVDLIASGGAIDAATGEFFLDLKTDVDHLAFFLPLIDPALDGQVNVVVRADGNYQTQEMAAKLKAIVGRLSGLPPLAMETIGHEVVLNMEASMKKEVIQIKQADITWKDGGLKADGRLNTNRNTFEVQYDLQLKTLPSVMEKKVIPLAEDLKSHGRVEGVFEKFTANVEFSMNHFQVNDLKGENLQVRLKTTGLPGAPSGELDLKGTAMEQPLRLHTGFEWSGKTLTLSDTNAEIPGMALKADLQMTPSENLFSGKVEGIVKTLELLEALTGVKAQARGNFVLQAGAPFKARLDAAFEEMTFQDYAASALDLKVEMDDLEKMRGQATMNAANVRLPNALLSKVGVKVAGSPKEATANLEARGTASYEKTGGAEDLPVTLKTEIAMKKNGQMLFQLNTFNASYGDLHIASPHPAVVTVGDGGMALDNLELTTGKGDVQATARLEGESVQASAGIKNFPLDLLEPFVNRDMTGTVDIKLNLSGSITDPRVQLNLHVREHKLLDLQGGKPLLLEAKLNSRHDGARFIADLELSGLGAVPFKADGVIPGHLSLMPFSLALKKDDPITGKLQGRLDLVIFKSLPELTGQEIEGLVEVDMGISGTMNNWGLTGGIVLRQGRYENVEQGFILADINGRMVGKGKTVRLMELTATDGTSGAIRLDGEITVNPPFPMEAFLTLNKATLLRKEELTSMAGGKLDLKGNMEQLELKGEVTLERTEFAIPGKLPPDVVVVSVTEINVPPGMASEQPVPKDSLPLSLDLIVQIPSRFFVRGRGLDAEFKGKLRVKGPADNPVIRGNLDVVRGTFNFLDRKFTVTNGQIAFSGATPPVPFLNITTQVNAGEIDARVSISGPADAFTLSLSSQPPLPQDEIMANILFGRSVADLNAFQAYQIASSISQIAGGGMPDLVGKTRSLLGIDRLDFSGGDEKTGPSVSMGKYVSEKVYVGVEQDLTDNKQDVVVEVDITPNFSVESKAGSKSGAGLGFNWKFDY